MNELVLEILIALLYPEPVTDPFVEEGEIWAKRLEDEEHTSFGTVDGALTALRELTTEVKKLRKDFNAEANYQDWRGSKQREDE